MDFKLTISQQDLLLDILSGLLSHENYDSEIGNEVLKELQDFIKPSELYGVAQLVWRLINNRETLRLFYKGKLSPITPEVLQRNLEYKLEDIIKSEYFDAPLFFRDNSKEFNLEIQTELHKAIDFTYTYIMDKFEVLYEEALPTEEALIKIPSLREDIKRSMAFKAVSMQGQILTEGIKYKNKNYIGYDGWEKFNTSITDEIKRRFTGYDEMKRNQVHVIDSYEKSAKFDEENRQQIQDLWYMGFEPVDNTLRIRTQDIVTLIADEGTGKTRIMIDQCYKAIRAGQTALVCCGETSSYKIKKLIEARHIWEKYQRRFTLDELESPERIVASDEDKFELQTMIRTATIDLYENDNYGKFLIVQDLVYETVEDQLTKLHQKSAFNVVFIDHVGALDASGAYVAGERLANNNARITHLYKCEDRLVKELNIAFFNLSHTSTDATASIRKGKGTGVRAGAESSATTKYASMVMLITQPEDFKKADQIVLQFLKIRDWNPISTPMVISRKGAANAHEYNEKLQYLVQGETVNDSLEDLIAD